MRLTTSGIIFLIVGATLCIAAYRFSLPGLLPVGILLVGLVLVSLLVAVLAGSQLKCRIRVRSRAVQDIPVVEVGSPVLIEAFFIRPAGISMGRVQVQFVPVAGFGQPLEQELSSLSAQAATVVPAVFTPRKRGRLGLQAVNVHIDGPFGLSLTKRRVHAEVPVVVAPAPARVLPPRTTAVGSSLDPASRSLKPASARDFHAREYVPGDDLRHVHWGLTARHGHLMVRNEAEEEVLLAALVIDTAQAADDDAELTIRAGAAAGRAMLAAGFDVTLFSAAGKQRFAGDHSADALALTCGQLGYGAAADLERATLRQASALVVCAATTDRAEAIDDALPRGQRRRILIAEHAPAAAKSPLAELPSQWCDLSRNATGTSQHQAQRQVGQS